jgi:hypothetical protein
MISSMAAVLGESNVARNVAALHCAATRVGKIAHDHGSVTFQFSRAYLKI